MDFSFNGGVIQIPASIMNEDSGNPFYQYKHEYYINELFERDGLALRLTSE